ncbi:hypothetical protein DM01DRAFT_1374679 [Hesseltinella vesiculosa]|uniref:RRM domain-containing protein n=1 Tax=Hesseltinella vesiculosa TaxID=101127 RepID=A0A1X2GGL0_9FUNG|nr:hypothetical protein DM01DRAFT_1374679 [Hesseltinella vesiculosa]
MTLYLGSRPFPPQMSEEISTIFVIGFPDDMLEREFRNMFLFASGFEASTLKLLSKNNVPNSERRKQLIGFAKFRTRAEAIAAKDLINGRKIDNEKGSTLKSEMAKKNLHVKRSQLAAQNISYSTMPPPMGYIDSSYMIVPANTYSSPHPPTGKPFGPMSPHAYPSGLFSPPSHLIPTNLIHTTPSSSSSSASSTSSTSPILRRACQIGGAIFNTADPAASLWPPVVLPTPASSSSMPTPPTPPHQQEDGSLPASTIDGSLSNALTSPFEPSNKASLSLPTCLYSPTPTFYLNHDLDTRSPLSQLPTNVNPLSRFRPPLSLWPLPGA